MKQLFDKKNVVFLIPAILMLIGILLYPSLPDNIPMQFSLSGETNWSMPKVFGAWMMPVLELIIILLDRFKQKKSPLIPILIVLSLIQVAIWCFTLV